MKIVIIGGGSAGIAAAFCLGKAGHYITVVETAPAVTEVGAGIQVGPNMSRLLMRWGLGEHLKQLGVKPLSVSFHRYSTGGRMGFSVFGDTMEFEHGAPYYHLHRADLIGMLSEIAGPFMTLCLGSRVLSVDPKGVSVTLESGEILHGDIILGADGVKSVTRSGILGGMDYPLPTGDSVYRAIIPTSEMMKDPLLRPLVDVPEVSCWMGPGKHIVGYCIRAKREYNLVLLCPEGSKSKSPDSWTATGSLDEMRSVFKGWEPRVENLLKLVRTTMTGTLVVCKPLTTWLDSKKRIAPIGDACTPSLTLFDSILTLGNTLQPYRAQGSAMAIEDASVLGNIFSRISYKDQIPVFLEAYEKIRIVRTTSTQAASWSNQRIFHLPDGAEQQARDNSMRAAMFELFSGGNNEHQGNANMWAEKEKNFEQFSYDADEAVNQWWRTEGAISLHRQFAKM
ncbi:hypothetical protein B0H10DRAFT_1816654 [Mycena sp. CBHHK59/15]|nr:hypothetical protein B0H10DRAFT_1816654 [Mycena sp. CBHHK59/15]